MRRLALFLIVFAALGFGPAHAAPPGPLILVSIDGYRAEYFHRGLDPTLQRLAMEGVRASAMSPSFPSLTYPNHYTLVTGLRPDHHGVIDNTMEDPAKPGVRFAMASRDITADPFWWNGAPPLWVTAERQGVRTATMFWPGSDVEVQGVRPHDWRKFDMSVTPAERVDTVLGWLDAPPGQRPRFLTLYFDDVDHDGHLHGVDSPELAESIRRVDAALARLVAGLKARGLYDQTNLVVVSDHGMASISRERVVVLDDLVDLGHIRLVTSGSTATLAPAPGHEAEVERALLGRHGHAQCWRKGEVPERFHYGSNPRVQPIVCLADTDWQILTRERAARPRFDPGAHGFDPAAPEMQALFVARGPAFRSDGAVIGPIENVDVYPLLMRVLDLPARMSDGNLERVAPALRR